MRVPRDRSADALSGPWREPGQAVDAAYRRDGRLRYAAEGREIVGHNGPYFNNRPLYCTPNTEVYSRRPML